MKACIVLCILSLAVMALARPEGAVVDLDEILGNRRLIPYVESILDQSKSAPEELKEHVKEVLDNECINCPEPLKKGTMRVFDRLINNEAD